VISGPLTSRIDPEKEHGVTRLLLGTKSSTGRRGGILPPDLRHLASAMLFRFAGIPGRRSAILSPLVGRFVAETKFPARQPIALSKIPAMLSAKPCNYGGPSKEARGGQDRPGTLTISIQFPRAALLLLAAHHQAALG
jgi:hypothetical protein